MAATTTAGTDEFRLTPGHPGVDEESVDRAAWDAWLRTRHSASPDLQARNWLLTRHLGLVRTIAAGYSIQIDLIAARDELTSFAVDGLMDALDRFDPDVDVEFGTYASYRIRGAIIDGLRQIDWAPRSVRAFTRRLVEAEDRFVSTRGRPPTRSELADELGITTDQLAAAEARRDRARLASLDVDYTSVEGDAVRVAETIRDERNPMETADSRMLAERMLLSMPERSRLVLYLSIVEGMVLADIAAILGVTESRVCQIRSSGLRQLRTTFGHLGDVA